MNRFGRASVRGVTLALCAALVLAVACGESSTKQAASTATPAASAAPPEVVTNASAWPLPNKDYANTRAVTDGTITAQNVAQLGVAWSAPITGASAFGAAATNPLIVNGLVIYQDLKSNVVALDLATGQEHWRTDYNTDNLGPDGVAVGYGKVFAAKDPHTIAALSLSDGEELWATTLATSPGEGIDIQPLTYNNRVYVSTIPGTLGGRFYQGGDVGIIYALDQATGKVLWQFNTVDSEDHWGNPQVNGGGGAWYPPAIDTDTGVTYWGTGNPAPVSGTPEYPAGTSRPGPNLYTNSVLALDSTTGALNWYSQLKPHDLFDLDAQLSPIIAHVLVDGHERKVVIGGGKLGRVVALDAVSGETLWDTPVGQHQNDEVQSFPVGETITVLPGALGGVETPMAFADGVVYAPVLNNPTTYTATAGLPPGFADLSKGTGQFVAIDASTGRILWDQPLPGVTFGGATVVNDLVFTSTLDGTVLALNRADGSQAWSWKAPAGINGWPAVAGDTIIIPAGAGTAPAIIALKLGATGPAQAPALTAPPSPTASPSAAATPAPTSSPSQQATAGTSLTISTLSGSTFDKDTLTAAANAPITVTYTNNSDIPHNIHFYEGSDASAPSLGKTAIVTGPNAVESVSFTPPGPGSYWFQCDVHPTLMTGHLLVQ
jgi:glucose dehydrogenase/plastocyanin